MKQLINILFLCISISFSFGFTTYQSACNHVQIEKEQEKHSCCHDTNDEKPACHVDEVCDENCCLQPQNVLQLADFFSQNTETKQAKIIKYKLLKSYSELFSSTFNFYNHNEEFDHPNELVYLFYSSQQFCIKNQTWLI